MTTIKEKYAANIMGFWDFRKGSLVDQSGNSFTAAVIGTPLWSRDRYGRTIAIDNTSSGLTLGKILGTSEVISNLTIVVQMKSKSLTPTYNRIVKKFSEAGSTAGSVVFDVDNTGAIRFLLSDSTNAFTTVSTAALQVKTGTPLILGATFNGTTSAMRIFADGVLTSGVGVFTESTIPLYDYNWVASYGGAYTGLDDFNQIVVFNIALTTEEMAQLYEQMLQEGNYSVPETKNICNPARSFIADGDMELADASAWSTGSSATLSWPTTAPHEGTRCLRVTYGGEITPYAQQSLLTIGKTYRMTGWARTDGVSPYARVFVGNSNIPIIVATTSTWTYFDQVKTAISTSILLQAYTGGLAGQYCEFDDVKVTEVSYADPVYIADGVGWNVTLANATTGNVSNSDWKISSGTWSVVDLGDVNRTKYINCVAAGLLYKASGQAYGTWEFDIYKNSTDDSLRNILMSNIVGTLGTTNSYYFYFGSDEKFYLVKDASGLTTLFSSTDTFSLDTWYRIKITRTTAGVFMIYHSTDGGITYTQTSGATNPVTSTTHTRSNFTFINTINVNSRIKNFKYISYT